MIKNKLPIRYTGQHFTIDKVLIDDAIKIAKINENDTVIDIGAGKGFFDCSFSSSMHKSNCNRE
jgi:23S rRNA (adenine-N6)-dimethyltransferase